MDEEEQRKWKHTYKKMEAFLSTLPREKGLPILATHIPYTSLPESISASGCRIVYVYRDPKDLLVSFWHFATKVRAKDLPPLFQEEMLEQFARGVSPYGSYWDQVLGYWKASLEWPHRVLFLKYDEMKSEPAVHVKRLAEFMGQPLSLEEERDGAVHALVELCSFEGLSNLEVKKTGKRQAGQSLVWLMMKLGIVAIKTRISQQWHGNRPISEIQHHHRR
ncbi:hypothetical protein AAG906_024933 [Vitis piasezkii]